VNEKTDKPLPATTSFLDGKTLVEVFLKRAQIAGSKTAFLVKSDKVYHPQSWASLHQKVACVFDGLRSRGLGRGDRIAILSNSRPEWFVCDMAIQALGAVTVPIYQSCLAEEVEFILKNSGAKLVFAENAAQSTKLETAFKTQGKPLPVVFFQAPEGGSFPFETLESWLATPVSESILKALAESVQSVQASDAASIVYTSGTTGQPKGARLLHSCFAAEIRSISQEIELVDSDICLTFLPFAHVLGRVESYIPIMSGISLAFAENVNSVSQNILEVRPTVMISVPRIYEKIFAKISSEVGSGSESKRKLFEWAIETGRKVARLKSTKTPIPLLLLAKNQIADRLVFSKVRAKLGGRIRFTVSGGAPLSQELCEFFHACGIKILEGYGLTETTGAIAVNRPNDYRFGTVGRPLAQTSFRLAADGEIQVKGPAIFAGYHENETATAEALTPDSWFCTGDIGEFSEHGFLKITDRKKELIVTSGGKNIAPQKLENLVKQIPLVSQAFVYGDKQKYLVALITLAEPESRKWAREQGVAYGSFEDLVSSPPIKAHLEKGLKQMNQALASYESVKHFRVLQNDFTLESGELTPSLKLKRKVISARYQKELEALY
jgi:long-chain acyl-CoA synthetase